MSFKTCIACNEIKIEEKMKTGSLCKACFKPYIYYAHSMKIYGTYTEEIELEYIKNHIKNSRLMNPKIEIEWTGSMKPYWEAVEKAKAVICSEFFGHIGKGVYSELKIALKNKIPCYVLRGHESGRLHFEQISSVYIDNEDDWQVYFGKINTVVQIKEKKED